MKFKCTNSHTNSEANQETMSTVRLNKGNIDANSAF